MFLKMCGSWLGQLCRGGENLMACLRLFIGLRQPAPKLYVVAHIRGDCFALVILLTRLLFQPEAVDGDGGAVGEDDEAATMAGAERKASDLNDRGQPGSPQDGAEVDAGAERAEV
jgi:hypothetical protein